MTSILALSVSDKIDQYGAYAGFASVVGLAVLSLLYFAQAREVKRLREWAGRAPERAVDVQDRATAAAQQRVIAQPQRPPGAPAPASPVGVGGPASRPAPATPAGQAAAAPGAAAAAATAAGAAATAPGAPGAAGAAAGAVTPGAPGPGQSTTVQPAANGAAAASPPARPGQPLRVPGAAATPPTARAAAAAGYDDEDGGRSPLAIIGAAGALLIVVAVVALLVTGVIGGGDDSGTQGTSTVPPVAETTPGDDGKTKTSPEKVAAAPKPGSYTVAVLNGTAVPGLARGVANRLQNTKYKIGNVTNAADQTRSATQVEYAPGHRAEADSVAKAIDVGSDAIVPLTAGSKTIAGDQATVVVTVGSDQNANPQQTTTG
jgi:LytR cell envelope-related transcriptional attenuator